ncbi:MAG: hypothetical protein U0359_18245 [Byssovorax sp.]
MASSTHASVTFALAALALAACGGSVVAGGTTGSGGQSSTGTTTTTGAGGGSTGDCAADADCPGGTCIPLTPGGYKVCAHIPDEAKTCTMPPGPVSDQCCSSADCSMGACYPSNDLPYCGGIPMPTYNLCLPDGCTSDEGCIHDNPEPWICLPKGAFGYPTRTCFTAYCKTNADCTAKGAGACMPIADPCCSVPQGLACVYADGCTKDTDCAIDGSQHCGVDPASGSAMCLPGFVGCPA